MKTKDANGEDTVRKVLCHGLQLLMTKIPSQSLVEFSMKNSTSFLFIIDFTFSDLNKARLRDDSSLERHIEINPYSTVKFAEFSTDGQFSYKYSYKYQKLSQDPIIKRVHISEELELVINQNDIEKTINFELINGRPEMIHFELIFLDMSGIKPPNGSMQIVIDLPPKSARTFCELSFAGIWSYKYTYKYYLKPADVNLEQIKREQNQELEDAKFQIRSVPVDVVPLKYLERIFGENKFTDHLFPPNDYSILGYVSEQLNEIQWRRPGDFMVGEIKIYEDDLEDSTIMQGTIENNWLMALITTLLEKTEHIKNMFYENSGINKNGIYRVKLLKNGENHTMTIDDYFPCHTGMGPIFNCNHGPELWVMLLEKSYAKINGYYYSLRKIKPTDSIIDLTGCPSFSYTLQSFGSSLWNQLNFWKSEGASLVVSTKELFSSTGILQQRFFYVNRLETVNETELIQLKNPWDEYDWTGDWSDQSPLWTLETRETLRIEFDNNDGSFWICINDLFKNFENIIVSRIKKYIEYRLKTLMEKYENIGKSTHCWEIEISEPTKMFIGVHQEDENSIGARELRKYLDLGLAILRKTAFGYENYFKTQTTRCVREIYWEGSLETGSYLVIPTSTAASLTKPADFIPLKFPLITEMGDLHPIFKNIIRDLYRRLSYNVNAPLNFDEFFNFNKKLGVYITSDIFVKNILSKYTSTHDGLTRQGFFEIFIDNLKEGKEGEERVRNWLCLLGYDEHFYSIESKPLILSFQGETDFKIARQELSPDINSFIWQ
ncbi:unnamed protein product [Blepharisma stoltei]|uniref:Calpain catalytic domain-containing protein n=1 Tax=Blepharisma stoltei TaxID=1481888 RepID=A0AAU9K5J4_9CILI|nr:unnamed protein product [Blepharisma stoltei]